MEKTGFEGSLQDFFEFMRTDPQFYYPDNEEGRKAYLNQVSTVIDTLKANIDQLFHGLPTIPLMIKISPLT